MMYKERIEQYLSGCMDAKSAAIVESALLNDADLLNSFIETAESSPYTAPSTLVSSVMNKIIPPVQTRANEKIPVLSRKLRAAFCFSSAAAVTIFTVFGFNEHIYNLILKYSDKVNELLIMFKIL